MKHPWLCLVLVYCTFLACSQADDECSFCQSTITSHTPFCGYYIQNYSRCSACFEDYCRVDRIADAMAAGEFNHLLERSAIKGIEHSPLCKKSLARLLCHSYFPQCIKRKGKQYVLHGACHSTCEEMYADCTNITTSSNRCREFHDWDCVEGPLPINVFMFPFVVMLVTLGSLMLIVGFTVMRWRCRWDDCVDGSVSIFGNQRAAFVPLEGDRISTTTYGSHGS